MTISGRSAGSPRSSQPLARQARGPHISVRRRPRSVSVSPADPTAHHPLALAASVSHRPARRTSLLPSAKGPSQDHRSAAPRDPGPPTSHDSPTAPSGPTSAPSAGAPNRVSRGAAEDAERNRNGATLRIGSQSPACPDAPRSDLRGFARNSPPRFCGQAAGTPRTIRRSDATVAPHGAAVDRRLLDARRGGAIVAGTACEPHAPGRAERLRSLRATVGGDRRRSPRSVTRL